MYVSFPSSLRVVVGVYFIVRNKGGLYLITLCKCISTLEEKTFQYSNTIVMNFLNNPYCWVSLLEEEKNVMGFSRLNLIENFQR